MRSVHTLASVQSHLWGTSLPCLAIGTPGSLNCDCVSFTLPPSCPPWLHGHYPLRSYYGDSDSCPAPSSTRTGLLDYQVCISRHSVSNHPMRPRFPAMLLVPGGLDLRFAFCRLSAVLRTSHVARSLVSRIRPYRVCVAGRLGPSVLRTILSFPVALHAAVASDAVTFNSWREAPPQRDFHPPMHAPSQAHERRFLIGLNCD